MSRKKWLEQLKPGDWVTFRYGVGKILTQVKTRTSDGFHLECTHIDLGHDGLAVGRRRKKHPRIDPVTENDFSPMELDRMDEPRRKP